MDSEFPSPSGSSGTNGQPRSVSLIVVTFRSAQLLPGFFAALPDALAGVPEHEIVVVDNASGDDTLTVARQLCPEAIVVACDRNGGYAAGLNAGIAAARRSDVVLMLNPDVRLKKGSVSALLDALRDPKVGIAVPRIVGEDGVLQHSLHRSPSVMRAWAEALIGGKRAGRISALGETFVDERAYSVPTHADWASGAALAVSRACLESIGPWNEAFFLYSEETDYCLRARDKGFAVQLVPQAEAVHIGGEMTTSPRLWAMQAWNRVRLYRSRNNWAAAFLFRIGVAINEAIRAARGSQTHRAGLAAVLSARHRPVEVRGTLTPVNTARETPGYVCFSAQDFWYHNRAHSDIQLMRNVAATRRVLFVNSIGMRMPLPGRSTKAFRRIWRKVKSTAKLLRRPLDDVPDFFVLTPLTLPFYGSVIGRQVNAAIVRTQVRVISAMLGIRDPVYVVTIPTAWDVVSPLARRSLVYNRSDRHSTFPEADRELIEGYERKLLAHSDAVLYVSRALMESERQVSGDRAHFIDHGVDVHHFVEVPPERQPVEVAALPRPRIGFFGGLDDYVIDFDLLEDLAREFPDAALVLIGDATCSMTRFEQYPNVHWLGFRPYEQIPALGSSFDVAIMPWLDNDWIRHSNPIKLKEYLALGLPVVTTDFPEARHYEHLLHIASDRAHFVAEIRHVLASPPDRGRLRESILSMSWDKKATMLIDLCERKSVRGYGGVV